jgi:hypothetical protein
LAKQEKLASNSLANQLGKNLKLGKTHLPMCVNIRAPIPVAIGVTKPGERVKKRKKRTKKDS